MQVALKQLLRKREKEKLEIEWQLKEIEWRLDQESSVGIGGHWEVVTLNNAVYTLSGC